MCPGVNHGVKLLRAVAVVATENLDLAVSRTAKDHVLGQEGNLPFPTPEAFLATEALSELSPRLGRAGHSEAPGRLSERKLITPAERLDDSRLCRAAEPAVESLLQFGPTDRADARNGLVT